MSQTSSMGAATPEPPSPLVDPDDINTQSLDLLQSQGQRKILDIADDLRRQGLSEVIELPQVAVFGDQSSGKSSLLEAVTEIPFPRNENLCTRFATEIVMRRSPRPSISVRINPDPTRPQQEQTALSEFSRTITDFDELPHIIADAEEVMGLKVIGQSRAFARDVLTVEICGPTRPQLTLVDLPGLIHSANRMQTEDDVSLIKDLVLDYMKNPRTIILAVISAKNDYANQIVLKYCREVDPQGKRTLGIITKPDTLVEGSANQKTWLDLAQNRDIYFELGWHMVKNRSELEGNKSFIQRNNSERQFFSSGAYAQLPAEYKGIETLRGKLSDLLHDHLKKELPKLKTELNEKLRATSKELDQLGVKRSTTTEQRLFLTDIGEKINKLLSAGIRGQYEGEFFRSMDTKADPASLENMRRFRAVVQHLNLEWADQMHRLAHKYAIPMCGKDETTGYSEIKKEDPEDLPKPVKMTRDEGIEWVQRTLERSRGCELAGNFNPLIISHLFWEQSSHWKELAMQHVEKIADDSKIFVNVVLDEVAPADIKSRISDLCVDVVLEEALKAAKNELERILEDEKRHPMTYNHYFTTKIQTQRKSRYTDALSAVANAAKVSRTPEARGAFETFVDPAKLEANIAADIERNMARFSAEDALDSVLAYYADELKYFINCVCKQVVERHLIDTLGHKVLTSYVIAGLSDEQIAMLAAEAPEVSRNRERLEDKRRVLMRGLGIFKEALGGFA